MTRIRLMQLTSTLDLGGLERVVETIATTIDRDRFDVSVLCLRERGFVADRLIDQGIPVHLLNEGSHTPDRLAFLKVARILRQHRIQVLHTHNTEPFIDGALAARLAGVKTTIHTDHARPFPDARKYMIAEYLASHLVYRVVGVSEASTRNLRVHERIPARRLVTILNGVDPAAYSRRVDAAAKRRSLGIPVDAPVIGTASRLEEQKGLVHLIRALPRVAAELPGVRLVIAGDGPLRRELQELAASSGVAHCVTFLGVRHDVAELMQVFDVFALPSLWEGLPMAVLEAMTSGCAVVASNVGGVPMAVEHEHSGLLVPPQDDSALTTALLRVLRDRAFTERLIVNARRRFTERFSAVAMTRQYERLYLRQPL